MVGIRKHSLKNFVQGKRQPSPHFMRLRQVNSGIPGWERPSTFGYGTYYVLSVLRRDFSFAR
jgi:hypothetical protein